MCSVQKERPKRAPYFPNHRHLVFKFLFKKRIQEIIMFYSFLGLFLENTEQVLIPLFEESFTFVFT